MSSFLGAVTSYFWPSAKKGPDQSVAGGMGAIQVRDEDDTVIVDMQDEKNHKTQEVAQAAFQQTTIPNENRALRNTKAKNLTYRKVTHKDLFGVGKNTINGQTKQDKKNKQTT